MLTVSEIYLSIQGESTHTGRPCVFVRLAACNLRCVWCDTPYAFTGGTKKTIDEVLGEVRALGCHLVEITGGEPLLQPDAIPLMERLVAEGFEVLLETGGHMPIDDVPDEVVAIVDVKCPGSGEAGAMLWPNLDQLSPHDEVKFVIRDRADFDFAVDVIERYALAGRVAAILVSPVFGVLEPADLARWVLDAGAEAPALHSRTAPALSDGPSPALSHGSAPAIHSRAASALPREPVPARRRGSDAAERHGRPTARGASMRLQLQTHKYIWDPATRGV